MAYQFTPAHIQHQQLKVGRPGMGTVKHSHGDVLVLKKASSIRHPDDTAEIGGEVFAPGSAGDDADGPLTVARRHPEFEVERSHWGNGNGTRAVGQRELV